MFLSDMVVGRCVYSRFLLFFFSSRRRHTRCGRDWSSDVCSSDLVRLVSGKLDIRHVAGDIAADKAGPKAAGQYQKLYIALNRLQQLGGSSWRLHTALNAQLASKNLASSRSEERRVGKECRSRMSQ